MGDATGIEWTDATWNPIRGCSRVSEGCRHCYAEQQAARTNRQAAAQGRVDPYEGLVRLVAKRGAEPDTATTEARWTGVVRMIPEHLADPLRWRKPRRIFVNSMSDLFHESLTNEQIAAVFGVMAAAPQHTFQVLTKRARRMREWFAASDCRARVLGRAWEMLGRVGKGRVIARPDRYNHEGVTTRPWPLPNVWLGTSVENQAAADERIPELLKTPAAIRFLSCEPLLGPVDLRDWMSWPEAEHGGPDARHHCTRCGLEREPDLSVEGHECPPGFGGSLHWVIAGIESGPGARDCDVAALLSLLDQCEAAGVPFFAKQWRAAPGVVAAGEKSHRKPGGIIGAPYVRGVQHLAMPGAKP